MLFIIIYLIKVSVQAVSGHLCLASISQGSSVRRAFPPSGDKCHSCERRVYMVERVCAEGLFFHRECFRCSTCSSALRQGAHAFDSEQGTCLNGSHLSSDFTNSSTLYWHCSVILQENCTANCILIKGTMEQTHRGTFPRVQWVHWPSESFHLTLAIFTQRRKTAPVVCLRIVLQLELRSNVRTMDRARSPAARRTRRVDPQQVSSARSWGNTWAGPWVWSALCATPPAICPAVCAVPRGPSPATCGTMAKITRPCTSSWA